MTETERYKQMTHIIEDLYIDINAAATNHAAFPSLNRPLNQSILVQEGMHHIIEGAKQVLQLIDGTIKEGTRACLK